MKKESFHSEEFQFNYLLGRLSDDEEILFEEHLLYCEKCRNELIQTETIIEGVKKAGIDAGFTLNEKKTGNRISTFLIGIAASVFIALSGITAYFLLHNTQEPEQIGNRVVKTNPIQSTETTHTKTKERIKEKVNKKTKTTNKTLVAEVFVPLEFYENLIENNTYRSEQVKAISPEKGEKFEVSNQIVFNWESNENLFLVIIDNKGKILFEEKVQPSYQLKAKLQPGLYYWQIENEDEALFVGKFFIK